MQPLIEIDVPATPDHECLDDYLRLGWFRNGYYMAIAPLVLMDGDVFPVLSVRARLEGYRFRKSLRRVRGGGDRDRYSGAREGGRSARRGGRLGRLS